MCADETPGDPKDPKAASERVGRGGCWVVNSGQCRVVFCVKCSPANRGSYLGLRLARVPVGVDSK